LKGRYHFKEESFYFNALAECNRLIAEAISKATQKSEKAMIVLNQELPFSIV
jgi:hypothetical protein